MEGLSTRQTEILGFISRHCAETGYPPTVREIGAAVGLASPSTVHAHLAKLEAAGVLVRDPTKPRAMLVQLPGSDEAQPPDSSRVEPIPLVGAVAAGAPVLAEEHVEEWVHTPFAADYLLTVRGDSMVNAGIFEGDLVAVRVDPSPDEGQIVVALIGEEATVKRLRRTSGRVELHPENESYEPIVPDEVSILGRVVGVLRSL
jgi:repressor LexA